MGILWDNYFIEMAKLAASKSKDPVRKVGCVIIGPDKEIRATGFNGFPRGVSDVEHRYENREAKLNFTVHAEANAIAAAARVGVSLKDCKIIVTKHPCAQCAALLIQAGVTQLLIPHYEDTSRWSFQNAIAMQMFSESGVTVEYYEPS
jgi:dCMP deaminase